MSGAGLCRVIYKSDGSEGVSTPRLRMIDGALLPDKREERGEDVWP